MCLSAAAWLVNDMWSHCAVTIVCLLCHQAVAAGSSAEITEHQYRFFHHTILGSLLCMVHVYFAGIMILQQLDMHVDFA